MWINGSQTGNPLGIMVIVNSNLNQSAWVWLVDNRVNPLDFICLSSLLDHDDLLEHRIYDVGDTKDTGRTEVKVPLDSCLDS